MRQITYEKVHVKRGDEVVECDALVIVQDGKIKLLPRTPEVACQCEGKILVYEKKEETA